MIFEKVISQKVEKYKIIIRKAKGRPIKFLIWKSYDLFLKRLRKYLFLIEERVVSLDKIRQIYAKQSNNNLRNYLRNRKNFHFFFQEDEAGSIIRLLTKHDKSYKVDLINKAEQICKNSIYILGGGQVYLGEKIDWNKDYRSGLKWGRQYAFDYNLIDMGRPSDVRVVWELSRLHILVDLGRAFQLTGDRKYVSKFKDLVVSWQNQNPVAYSINWGCAMEAAIRSINLIWALVLFLPSSELDNKFISRYLHLLILHGRFIYKNLEYSDIRGNHYLTDLAGLVYLGLFLPEYPDSKRWLDYSTSELEVEMQHQVYPDGVDHEGSIPYHRLVVEIFQSTALLLKKNQKNLSDTTMERLEKMIEFVGSYIKPDGLCPLFGDNDDGRLHILGNQDINDHRYLLSTGAVIFRRGDFKWMASRFWEESAWLLGIKGLNIFEQLEEDRRIVSAAFPDGGFYIMRNSNSYIMIDCGDVGTRGRGGHGHNDLLSFELVLNGDNLISDTGCSSYTSDRKDRRAVIRTAAHNTVVVDGMEMAEILENGIASVARSPQKVITWRSDNNLDELIGENYGFLRLPRQVIHRRAFKYIKEKDSLEIIDTFTGEGQHKIAIYFHLDKLCDAKQNNDGIFIKRLNSNYIYRLTSNMNEAWRIQESFLYPRYAVQSPSKTAVLAKTIDLPATFWFNISAFSV